MSPNVGNFVHDLVEMAKAMETLPQVQNDLDMAKRVIDGQAQTIQNREEAIQRYKAEIETLNAKVRATEAERDDAELRFLELDEKTHQVMGMLIDFEGKAKGARLILDPSKSQPEPEPVVVQNPDPQTFTGFQPKDESATDPTTSHATEQATSASSNSATNSDADNIAEASQSQGEGNPPSAASPVDYVSGTGEQPVNAGENAITSPESKTEGPYANKYYSDHPVYVSLHDWLAGGGTEDKYYPRAVRDEYKY